MESPLRVTEKEPHLEFLFPNVGSLDSSCPTLERKDTPRGDWVYVSHHLCVYAAAHSSRLAEFGAWETRRALFKKNNTRLCIHKEVWK